MRALRQWYPAVIWGAAIWLFSTGSFSARSTSRFILPLLHWMLPWASRETLDLMHFLIRKSGHFVEFFVFSLLVLRGIRGNRPGWKLAWGLAAVLIAACYAALDEFHQSFVPGRTASPMDSLLDTCGAAAAQLLSWLRMRWRPGPSRTPA
ncbi:MAG TPA: VanZ family protein [Candidatus Acidoferrales bacterium]|nr:VanZ family protein [Candidatus Acidoferrales bacterium]